MINWDRRDAWVAVFDILGFKQILSKADGDFHRHLLTTNLKDLMQILKKDSVEQGQLDYMIFSDTFVIWVPDLNPKSYPWFLQTCRALIIKSIYIRMPLRGAISVGAIAISKDPMIVIGSSFLDAHNYCEDQNWIGLLLTPSATRELRKEKLEPLNHDFVSDKIPLRKMPSEDVLAYRFQNGLANFESPLIGPLEEMHHYAPEDAKEKYEMTIAFIRKHYRRLSTPIV